MFFTVSEFLIFSRDPDSEFRKVHSYAIRILWGLNKTEYIECPA